MTLLDRVAAIMLALLFAVLPGEARAAELVIAGSTDRPAIEPLIKAFEQLHPTVTVRYDQYDTIPLHEAVEHGSADPKPDLVISSAVDRQFKLVNDGLTQPWRSDATARLPRWARWGEEAFGFTYEPLVFVVNRSLLPRAKWPTTRASLAGLAESDPAFAGRIATYDPHTSGVGYLVANLDVASNSRYWDFLLRIAAHGLLTFCCSSEMLDAVVDGRAVAAFNVLGSYAWARAAAGADIEIIYPGDYTFALSRVAVIPKAAANPQLAGAFIDFLLSPDAQEMIANRLYLSALDDRISTGLSQRTIKAISPGPVRAVAIDVSLLAFSDRLHQVQFMQNWDNIVKRADH
jgi:ABC-type Fe3+ transport system substrate-binding protein